MANSRIVTRRISSNPGGVSSDRPTRGRSRTVSGTGKAKKKSPSVWGALFFAGALVGLGFYGMEQAGFKRVTA